MCEKKRRVRGESLMNFTPNTEYENCAFYAEYQVTHLVKDIVFNKCSFRTDFILGGLQGVEFENCSFSGKLHINISGVNVEYFRIGKFYEGMGYLTEWPYYNIYSISAENSNFYCIPPLAKMKNLQVLNVKNNSFINLRWLPYSVKHVSAPSCGIERIDESIHNAAELKRLILYDNNIENLRFDPRKLPQLEMLDLRANPIARKNAGLLNALQKEMTDCKILY